MDTPELQAKAIIAAALITSHAVEIPAVPRGGGHWTKDPAALRLRDLTEYVYQTIVGGGSAASSPA